MGPAAETETAMRIRFPGWTRVPALEAGVDVDDQLIDIHCNGKGMDPDMPDYIRWTASRMAVGERRVCAARRVFEVGSPAGRPVCKYEIERIS